MLYNQVSLISSPGRTVSVSAPVDCSPELTGEYIWAFQAADHDRQKEFQEIQLTIFSITNIHAASTGIALLKTSKRTLLIISACQYERDYRTSSRCAVLTNYTRGWEWRNLRLSDTLKSWRSVEGELFWVIWAEGFSRIIDEQMKKRRMDDDREWKFSIETAHRWDCTSAVSHWPTGHKNQRTFL